MKLVIDIHEKDYQSILNSGQVPYGVVCAIMNGTPLPKGHGRLIDADELEECKEIMDTISDGSKYAVRMDDIRNVVSTIIEADKEG